MEFLTEKFWNKFVNNDGKRNGQYFENLVKNILDLEQGEGRWISTKKSHDGSKDFYWYNKSRCSWAECKNYSAPIALNVISPTMVMAQICDVHEILFFSYSSINKNIKKKLIHFAEMSSKRIYFIDDEALEQVIFFYKDQLFDKYFPDFSKENAVLLRKKPQIHLSVFSDPMLYYNMGNEAYITQLPDSIEYNGLLGFYISISNRDMDVLQARLSIDETTGDYFHFEILPAIIKNGPEEYKISKMHTQTTKLYFRPVVYKPELKLPTIYVSYLMDGQWFREEFKYPPMDCNWIGRVRLTGEEYNEIVTLFQNKILNKNHLAGICLYGTSGSGKTRLLEECVKTALSNQYRILQFSLNELHKRQALFGGMIQDIIYAMFNLPNAEALYIAEEFLKADDTNLEPSTVLAFKLLHTLKKIHSIEEFECWLRQYQEIIFDRLFSQKLFLVIDNVQYYDDCIILFLNQLLQFGKNNNRRNQLVLGVVLNTDYITSDSQCLRLLNIYKREEAFLCRKIAGFTEGNAAKGFLRELLTSSIDLDDSYISKLLSKTSYLPFNIRQMVQWMEDMKIIQYHHNHCVLLNTDRFYKGIGEIPDSIHLIMEERWKFWCERNDKDSGIKIIAIMFLFNGLTEELIRTFKLEVSTVYSLTDAHFLKELNISETNWKFEHDLIQKFFSILYRPLADKIIKDLRGFHWNSTYLVQECYYLMATYHVVSSDSIEKLLHCFYYENLPAQFKLDFYNKLFDTLLSATGIYSDWNLWFSDCFSVILRLRNLEGSLYAISCYEKMLHFSYYLKKDIFLSINFGWLLLEYGNILDESGDYQKAISKLEPYVIYLEEYALNKAEHQKLICYFYNRLHVYYRHSIENPLLDVHVNGYLYKALCLSQEIEDSETLYVNYSDCGYMYYCQANTVSETLFYWNKALNTFEHNLIPQKTLNYFRKRVQVALIMRNLAESFEYIVKGLRYIETGKYAYHELFFKEWFLLAYIEYCLLSPVSERKKEIIEKLAEAEECSFLLHSPKTYNYYQLKSIFYYRLEEWQLMCLALKKCIELLLSTSNRTYFSQKKEMLCHNALIMSKKMSGNTPFLALSVYINCDTLKTIGICCDSCIPIGKAQSIIQAADLCINFPAL